MIRIQQIKLTLDEEESRLEEVILKTLKIKKADLIEYKIFRKSIDARKEEQLFFVYAVDVRTTNDSKVLGRVRGNKNISLVEAYNYEALVTGSHGLNSRPVIIGAGPAGLFCGLLLAEKGYHPLIIERGKRVEERTKDVETFWRDQLLNTESNVQFGEGGAGTFSDGKLNTLVKDKDQRGRKVLEEFVEAGAPQEILYINKPHIGTDKLRIVVKNIREKIEALGGEFRFSSKLTDIDFNNSKVSSITINGLEKIETQIVVLAIGHSARDTFQLIYDKGIQMTPKAFAVGVRIEHPQEIINQAQYGNFYNHPKLGAADYKLKHHTKDGRGVYSFCMCPGGIVVAAASEENTVVTNGMSYYHREEKNANSALLVAVSPSDFTEDHPLAGVAFQREIERKAFILGGGDYSAPIQMVGDFLKDQPSKALGRVDPSFTGRYSLTNMKEALPSFIIDGLKEGILQFGKQIKGFSMSDAIITGVESRSSSPIRIIRDEDYIGTMEGLYPAGEGAGYAGGIMSAAMDGMRVAEKIFAKFRPA